MELNNIYISNIIKSINIRVDVDKKAKDISNQICAEINRLRPDTITFAETIEEYVYRITPLKRIIHISKDDVLAAYERGGTGIAIQNYILNKIDEL